MSKPQGFRPTLLLSHLFFLRASESPPILLGEVENTQNEPISTLCLPPFDSAQGDVGGAKHQKPIYGSPLERGFRGVFFSKRQTRTSAAHRRIKVHEDVHNAPTSPVQQIDPSLIAGRAAGAAAK